ncbi:MAG: carbonic anhydrase [Kofleriaceae bacterium]
MKFFPRAASSLLFVALAACGGSQATGSSGTPMGAMFTDTYDAAEQGALSPAAVRAILADGNRRFVANTPRHNDLAAQRAATATSQAPIAAILSCIDSRSAPETVFDLAIGDVFAPRIAGNFVTPELIGSLEFATKVAGSKLVVVMGHTECGAVKGACDGVRLGNLTSVIEAIEPSVDAVAAEVGGERSSKNKPLVTAATLHNVERNVALLREKSQVLRELEAAGSIAIVGAIHDLATGEVQFIDPS